MIKKFRDLILEELYNSEYIEKSRNIINKEKLNQLIKESFSKMTDAEKSGAINVVRNALDGIKTTDPYMYEYMINWFSNRSIANSMTSENDPNCNTFQTTGPLLTWNPAFVKEVLKYDKNYVASVLVHEALHVIFQHHNRFEFVKDPNVWRNVVNVACDLAINQEINKGKFPLPKGIGLIDLDHPDIKPLNLPPDKDAIFYYNEMIKKFTKQPTPPQQPPPQPDQKQGDKSKDKEPQSSQQSDQKTDGQESDKGSEQSDKGEQQNQQQASEQDFESDQQGDQQQGSGAGGEGEEKESQTGKGKPQPSQEKQPINNNPSMEDLQLPKGWEKVVEEAMKVGELKPNPEPVTQTDIENAEIQAQKTLQDVAQKMSSGPDGVEGYGGIKYNVDKLTSKKSLPWNAILAPFKNTIMPTDTYKRLARRVYPTKNQLEALKNINFKDFLILNEEDEIIRKGKGELETSELVIMVDTSGSLGTSWMKIFEHLNDIFKPENFSENGIIRLLIVTSGRIVQEFVFRKNGQSGKQSASNPELSRIESALSTRAERKYVPIKHVLPLPINSDVVSKAQVISGGGTQLYPTIRSLYINKNIKLLIILTDGQLYGSDNLIFEQKHPFKIVWMIVGSRDKGNIISPEFRQYFYDNSNVYFLNDYKF